MRIADDKREVPNLERVTKLLCNTSSRHHKLRGILFFTSEPLVNVDIALENHHFLHGETHYFDWAMFNSYILTQPEGQSHQHSIESL